MSKNKKLKERPWTKEYVLTSIHRDYYKKMRMIIGI